MGKKGKFVLCVVLIAVQHLLNNASGSAQSNVCFTSAFDNTYTLTGGTWPHSMASADFNSDGNLDLIITNTPSATLSLLLGDGNGKFLEAPAIEVGSEPTGVTAADFNGDGKIDIAFAYVDINLVSIFPGNGDGTFQQSSEAFFVGERPLAIVSADFDNDGNIDLATANQAGRNISVSLGNGDGTFPDATFIGEGIAHYSIATGDFNDDGIIDLATANRDEENFTDGNISVFTGDGSGGFLAQVDYTAGLHPTFVTSSDLNQDGRSDLIAANAGSQNISVLLAKTTSGFDAPANYSIIGQPNHITSSDFDGDGFKDLAVVDVQSNNLVVFSGSASGSLTWRENYATGGSAGFIISPDINSDAVPDLVVLKSEAHSIAIWLGKPGNFFDGIKTNQVGFYPGALVTADFNLDGKKDIATPNYYGDNVSVLLANSTGTLDVAINSAAGTTPNSIAVSDFNSDGKLDIVACNYDVDQVSLIIGNGDGSFGAPVSYSVGSKPQGIVSADFNGDNKMDVAVVNSHDNNISILFGDGAGGLASGTIVTAGPSISGFASADFNKDGKFDLAVLDWTESNLTLMLSNGIGFIQGTKYPVGTNPSIILTADMDSDEIMDLVVSGNDYNISILKGTGTGAFSPRVDYTTNIPSALTVGYFNNDSKPDIAYNSVGNGLGILLSKPTNGFFPAIFFNSEQGSLASIDVNNDGLTDLAGIISSNVVVLYNNTAVIAAGGPTSFCSGNSVVLSATANGYTYHWNSGGSTTRDLTVTTGGSYNVTITNQNGSCSSTSNTILVSIPPPAPIVTKVHPNCDGIKGSITVNIRNATDTYSFDNGLTFQASNVKTDLTPGSYSVIIRESTGCQSLPGSVTLEAPIKPTEPQVNSSYFFCSESPASIFITQQNFDETYSVDFGNTFQSANIFHGLSAGTYEVVIKSRSGCVSPTKFVHIISLAPGTPDASVVQPTCHTPTGSISVVMKNWGDTYSFDDGVTFQSDFTKEGLIPGIYSVRVRTFSPCVSDPIAVEIIAPPPVPSQPLIITTQPSCTVSTGSASVEVQQPTDVYSFDNGLTFQSSPLMSGLPTGLHQVVIRNSAGCLSIASNVVLSNPPSTPLQPVVTVAQPTCDAAGSITVTAQTAGETYSFDNGVSFQTNNAKALVAGSYQVVIKSIGGCLSLSTSATIPDAPASPFAPLLTLIQPTCDVSEGSVTVAVQDLHDSYSFDGGSTFQSSPTKHGLIPGNYNVVIHRNDGCMSVGSTAIINQQPAKPITPVITFDDSDPSQPLLISSSGPIFKWFKDGVLITDQVSSNLIATSVGSYFVVAVNIEGCESEASDPVEITITSIEENSDSFQLYPNPTEDQISFNLIGFTLGKEIDITIVNTSGVVVRQQTIVADETTAINVAQLAQGEYILLLKQSEKTSTKSFIKK